MAGMPGPQKGKHPLHTNTSSLFSASFLVTKLKNAEDESIRADAYGQQQDCRTANTGLLAKSRAPKRRSRSSSDMIPFRL